jgi:hypothetical protein
LRTTRHVACDHARRARGTRNGARSQRRAFRRTALASSDARIALTGHKEDIMRLFRSTFICCVLIGVAATADAGERRVPSDYSTIQAAVNAAAYGDVVVCAAGTYTEAVTATKSGVTISGTGATWDGKTGTAAATCLKLVGDANVVSGFTFKNGVDQVVLTGEDCKVKNCASLDASGSFAVITGVRGRVDRCVAKGSKRSAIVLTGDGSVVTYVDVDTAAGTGIDVSGNKCSVRDCRVEKCGDRGYRVRGKECEVEYSEARSCATAGFQLEMDFGLSYSNYAKDCGGEGGAGYVLIGSSNTVTLSDAWACAPHGHVWKGDSNWCYDNWADWCEEDGFRCEGDDNDCEYNRAEDCGRDGHSTRGNRNRSYRCSAFESGDDGFDCESGTDNLLKYCTAKYNEGAGCENGGTATDVYACVFVDNEVDVGLDGSAAASFDLFSLNLLLSGSASTVLTLGFGL